MGFREQCRFLREKLRNLNAICGALIMRLRLGGPALALIVVSRVPRIQSVLPGLHLLWFRRDYSLVCAV